MTRKQLFWIVLGLIFLTGLGYWATHPPKVVPAQEASQAASPQPSTPTPAPVETSATDKGNSAAPPAAPPPVPVQTPPPTSAPVSESAGGNPGKALGSPSAPITIEVFSDFQCPACRAFYLSTTRPVIDNYVSTGKVYLIHRDFPLDIHKYSHLAARYANAAARIGRFEKVENALYSSQDFWAADGNVDAAVANALTPAEMKRLRDILQSTNVDADISQDQQLGNKVPVRQTPTIIVIHKGKTYPLPPGGVTYSLLRQFLDELLRQS